MPPPGLPARRVEGPPHPEPVGASEPHAAVAPTANADTPPDEAPAQGHARTAQFTYLYARMMDNDRSPPPPPMLSARQSLSPAANVQGAGSRHGGAPIHKSSMKRSMSDQSLRIQGRQPVNQDQMHRKGSQSGRTALPRHAIEPFPELQVAKARTPRQKSPPDRFIRTPMK